MFEPKNEIGVIVVFAQQADRHGFQIKSIRAAFPDAILMKDGRTYRTEFELKASTFDSHDHDCRECDLIVCWKKDSDTEILPVLALSDPAWIETDLTLPTIAERDAYYWQRRALKAERALRLAQKNNKAQLGRPSKRDQILYMLELDPDITQADIARKTGASTSYVCQVLQEVANSKEETP